MNTLGKEEMKVDKILSKLNGVVPYSPNKWRSICPAHADSNPSLFITSKDNRILLKCFSGCTPKVIVAAIGMKMTDLFINKEKSKMTTINAKSRQQRNSCTLEEYAKFKGIPVEFLKELGLKNSKYGNNITLRMPYLDQNGKLISTRYRISIEGEDKFRWKKRDHVVPYGLWRLNQAKEKGYVVIVEGESDCHTLWHKGIPAIGVPGATTWKEPDYSEYLKDIPIIYVALENDAGGEKLLNTLKASPLIERMKIIPFIKYKDPSDMYLSAPRKFRSKFKVMMKGARPLINLVSEEEAKKRKEAWKMCKDLAEQENIPERFMADLKELGVSGEENIAKTLYLSLTSRLLDEPVSVAIKGQSSSGKSNLVDRVLSFFPPDAYLKFTSMSEKALYYSSESLRNRFLIIYEAAGVNRSFLEYTIRSLLSEKRIDYMTVESKEWTFKGRKIFKEGPTGLITTTAKISLNPENETRLISFQTDDSSERTKEVLHKLAARATHEGEGPGHTRDILVKWVALQTWLKYKQCEVTIPYAGILAELTNSNATRIRRDFQKVLSLIEANALLHQKTRRKLGHRILADIDDYKEIYHLVADAISTGVDSSVPKSIRRTVKTVRKLIKKSKYRKEKYVRPSELVAELKLHKATISRHVQQAKAKNYLDIEAEGKGKPIKILLGDERLPADDYVLPDPKIVKKAFAKTRRNKAK